jgi:alpha-tubulin suppressor-like RCC1 family protein
MFLPPRVRLNSGSWAARLLAIGASVLAVIVTTPLTLDAQMAVGGLDSTAVLINGQVWTAGRSSSGTLGVASPTASGRVRQLVSLPANAVSVAHGWQHVVAVLNTGQVYVWGINNSGVFGMNPATTGSSNVPILASAWPANVVAVAAGYSNTYVLTAGGLVYSTGGNMFGELGNGTQIWNYTPQLVSGLTDIIAIGAGTSHAIALKSDGTVYTWGRNSHGQLGQGSFSPSLSTSPLAVSGLGVVSKISAGWNHNLVISNTGVYGWGNNQSGQLGDNTLTIRTSPVSVLVSAPLVDIDGGPTYSLAVTTLGAVLGWGATNVTLGLGTPGSSLTPVTIPGPTGIVTAAAIDNGSNIAIAGNGAVWGWGVNEWGKLGDGLYNVNRILPCDLATSGTAWREPAPNLNPWQGSVVSVNVTNILPALTMTYSFSADPTLSDPVIGSGGNISVGPGTTVLKVRTFGAGPASCVSTGNYW